jgi:hypothetical protein
MALGRAERLGKAAVVFGKIGLFEEGRDRADHVVVEIALQACD